MALIRHIRHVEAAYTHRCDAMTRNRPGWRECRYYAPTVGMTPHLNSFKKQL